ncbi:probable serine/threonine-protein kinase DDB_G0278665 isoform X1 [Schistocerca gregaria]|nr:probable serine/threonine-protein kinase DDB_G0278665 isoform X1 [Schistocerca gregaria]
MTRSCIYPIKPPSSKNEAENPVFNQEITLTTSNPFENMLHISVFDKNKRSKDILIGETRISLRNLTNEREHLAWYKLNAHSSEILVGLKAVDFSTAQQYKGTQELKQKAYSPDHAMAKMNENCAGGIPRLAVQLDPGYNANNMVAMQGQAPKDRVASFPRQIVQNQQSRLMYPGSMPKNYLYDSPQLLLQNQEFTCQSDFKDMKCAPLLCLNESQIHRDFPNIARGSFGVVYTGNVQGIKDKVIIKDMQITNYVNIENWKREVSIMNSVRCPYVVEILGYSSSRNILTIIMEYMKKGSLYEVIHIRKEPISILLRMRMARHCALGLAHLHAAGIMHRDVKSMNILVSSDYACKFTDFGCAKLVSSRNFVNTANSGTPLWMAPEVKAGNYSFSADIYSLGIVLYEIFERCLPQFDQVRQTVIFPIHFQSSNLVLQCVDQTPQVRPTAAQIVKKLDIIIRNILNKVRTLISPDEEILLKQNALTFGFNNPEMTQADREINQLYVYLLNKESADVDNLVRMAFSKSSDPVAPTPNSNPIHMGYPNVSPQQLGNPAVNSEPSRLPPQYQDILALKNNQKINPAFHPQFRAVYQLQNAQFNPTDGFVNPSISGDFQDSAPFHQHNQYDPAFRNNENAFYPLPCPISSDQLQIQQSDPPQNYCGYAKSEIVGVDDCSNSDHFSEGQLYDVDRKSFPESQFIEQPKVNSSNPECSFNKAPNNNNFDFQDKKRNSFDRKLIQKKDQGVYSLVNSDQGNVLDYHRQTSGKNDFYAPVLEDTLKNQHLSLSAEGTGVNTKTSLSADNSRHVTLENVYNPSAIPPTKISLDHPENMYPSLDGPSVACRRPYSEWINIEKYIMSQDATRLQALLSQYNIDTSQCTCLDDLRFLLSKNAYKNDALVKELISLSKVLQD